MADFSLIVLPGSLTSGVAVTLDMLSAAQAMAPRCGVPAPTWRVLSPAGRTCPEGCRGCRSDVSFRR